MSNVHIGEKIKQRAKQLRMGPTELGKLINTSKQNIHGIYKRKSIDSELLKEISKALEFNFFQYYSTANLLVAHEPETAYNSKDKVIKKLTRELETIRKQLDQLKKQVSEQENAYLKKRK